MVKSSWGVLYAVSSLLFAGAVFFILLNFSPIEYGKQYQTVFTVFGTLFSLMSFFVGHFSYPRVHNLKVYASGYVSGITGISYFLMFTIMGRSEGAITLLFILIFLNFICFINLPSFMKYYEVQRITYILAAVECSLIVLMFIFREALEPLFSRTELLSPIIVSGSVCFFTIMTLSIVKLPQEFYLGGIFTGYAFLTFLSFISPALLDFSYADEIEKALFIAGLLYYQGGMILHWFARMDHRVSYDPLLQIYNRTYCMKIIEEQSSVITTPPFSIAMIDIDHFKKVNDTYGHQDGDVALHTVAQTIQKHCIPEGITCRYGGEELIIFFPEVSLDEAFTIIERARVKIGKTKIMLSKQAISVTVSGGVACRMSLEETISDVIERADKALYKGKQGGRNLVCRDNEPVGTLETIS